jgi:outer membrane protein OmpA-like peptidoglycan-associated protein
MKERIDMTKNTRGLGILALAAALVAAGCASKGFVRQEIAALHDRDRELESNLEQTQTRLEDTEVRLSGRLDDQGANLDEASQTAREALQRAIDAGKLAEGKLLFETVLSDDKVKFGLNRAQLSDEAKVALDELGSRLTEVNREVYLEIQGHTDASGPEELNLELGEQRAEVVRRYLNLEHDIPLHRIATISYGEAAPVAVNDTREGRAQNRRVAVVVLR